LAKGWASLLETFKFSGIFNTNTFESEYQFAKLENANLQTATNISVSLGDLSFFKTAAVYGRKLGDY